MRNDSIEKLAARGLIDETVSVEPEMWERVIHSMEIEYAIDCLVERIGIIKDCIKWTSDPVIRELAQLRLKEATAKLVELKLIQ